jgi:hypothetical protein
MRIAQVAPLAESVPPKLYGGTERVISWLTEELVSLGHEVTLFASGDSQTNANLVPVWPRGLRLGRPKTDPAIPAAAYSKPSRTVRPNTMSSIATRIGFTCPCSRGWTCHS